MAVGLSPESWALLALCGVLLSFVTSLVAIEPGLILMPLLAAALPRMGLPAGSSVHIAAATAIVLQLPLSIAQLGLLRRAERQQILLLAPAIFAGAFFGASLMPFLPESWLLAGFAITAAIALLRRPQRIGAALAIIPPMRAQGPFAAIFKSAVSSLFGTGLPLSEGRRAVKAALALILSAGAAAALLQAPLGCKGCAGFVFLPALVAVAAGAVLKMPLLTALFGESSRPRLRPVVILAAVIALLMAPFDTPGTGNTALATLAPGLCRVGPSQAIAVVTPHRDPFPVLAQKFGPRRGLAAVKAGRPSQQAFVKAARQMAAHPPTLNPSVWTVMIEIRPPQKPVKRSAKHTTNTQAP
jgi:uncharacterized membrane protein YfcA